MRSEDVDWTLEREALPIDKFDDFSDYLGRLLFLGGGELLYIL